MLNSSEVFTPDLWALTLNKVLVPSLPFSPSEMERSSDGNTGS